MSDNRLEVIFITIPFDQSEQLSQQLVENKLAACVNILSKVKSVYRWEGKIETTDEAMLIVKTKAEVVNKLIEFVKENHPYDLPEIIALPIENGNSDYLDWINQEVTS